MLPLGYHVNADFSCSKNLDYGSWHVLAEVAPLGYETNPHEGISISEESELTGTHRGILDLFFIGENPLNFQQGIRFVEKCIDPALTGCHFYFGSPIGRQNDNAR